MPPTRITENAVYHNNRLYVRDIWMCEPGEILPIPKDHASFIYNNDTGLVEKSRYFIQPITGAPVTVEMERQVLQRILETAPNDFLITDALWGASHALLELRKLTNA